MSSSSTGPSDTPTGNYGLLVNSPSGKSDSCLDAKQQMAWTCMDGPTRLEISVQNPKTSAATVELTSSDSSQSSLSYGDQHPVIQGKVSASYNFDPEARDFGAALYFHAVYEKRVLLSFDEITALPSKRSMEDASIIEKSRISPRTTNKIPDEALVWDCRWPNTDIDGYIYVNEPTPGDAANAIPSGIATPTPTSPTRRGVTKVTKSQTPTDLYRRKVKIAEYRNQATPTPSCTLRQLCKSELVAPLAPSHGPKEIILHESISPHQKRTGLPQWDQDASVYETRAATGGGSCYCVWITT